MWSSDLRQITRIMCRYADPLIMLIIACIHCGQQHGNDGDGARASDATSTPRATSELASVLPSLLASLKADSTRVVVLCVAASSRGASDAAFRAVPVQQWQTCEQQSPYLLDRLHVRYLTSWDMLRTFATAWPLVDSQLHEQRIRRIGQHAVAMTSLDENITATLIIGNADHWLMQAKSLRELACFLAMLQHSDAILLTRGLLCIHCHVLTPPSTEAQQLSLSAITLVQQYAQASLIWNVV